MKTTDHGLHPGENWLGHGFDQIYQTDPVAMRKYKEQRAQSIRMDLAQAGHRIGVADQKQR